MISCEGGTVLDLQALPEGCIAKIISLTTPQDACRLSSVSTSFCSAAQSDVVWDNFLPPDIHTILSSSSLSYSPNSNSNSNSKSKEDLYIALCDNPVLIHEGKMSFSVDKWSGKKCYTISAWGLMIAWGDTPCYWAWISSPDSRFEEVAELLQVWWLEIRGKLILACCPHGLCTKLILCSSFLEGLMDLTTNLWRSQLELLEDNPLRLCFLLAGGRTMKQQLNIQRREPTAGWRWSWVSSSVLEKKKKIIMGSWRWLFSIVVCVSVASLFMEFWSGPKGIVFFFWYESFRCCLFCVAIDNYESFFFGVNEGAKDPNKKESYESCSFASLLL